MKTRLVVVILGVLVGAEVCASAPIGPITVTKGTSAAGSNEVRIVVPGRFKVVICDGLKETKNLGVNGYYDLRNDPDEKYNYAAPMAGLFWNKLDIDPRRDLRDGRKGRMLPAAGPVEVVEANALRVVVKRTGPLRAYGMSTNPVNPDVRFEQVFVVAAPDRLTQTLTLVGTGEEVKLKGLDFILHTSHAKWAGGSSKRGVYSPPAPWTWVEDKSPGPKSCVLHAVKPGPYTHGDGKTTSTHKANFLMVMHKAEGKYGYRANPFNGHRTSLDVADDHPVIRKGDRVTRTAMLVVNHEITDLEKAKPYVEEYRNPGVPKCKAGSVVGDGFDESTACYTLKAGEAGVDFTMPATWNWPMFEIAGWRGGPPAFVSVGGARKAAATGEVAACVEDGKLLVQIASEVPASTRIVITDIIRTK
jgi:hypothetical protein